MQLTFDNHGVSASHLKFLLPQVSDKGHETSRGGEVEGSIVLNYVDGRSMEANLGSEDRIYFGCPATIFSYCNRFIKYP